MVFTQDDLIPWVPRWKSNWDRENRQGEEKDRKRAGETEWDALEQGNHAPCLWVPLKGRADIILYKPGWWGTHEKLRERGERTEKSERKKEERIDIMKMPISSMDKRSIKRKPNKQTWQRGGLFVRAPVEILGRLTKDCSSAQYQVSLESKGFLSLSWW